MAEMNISNAYDAFIFDKQERKVNVKKEETNPSLYFGLVEWMDGLME